MCEEGSEPKILERTRGKETLVGCKADKKGKGEESVTRTPGREGKEMHVQRPALLLVIYPSFIVIDNISMRKLMLLLNNNSGSKTVESFNGCSVSIACILLST